MQGKQKLLYLPEAHTDYIYAVVGEELGIWGTSGLLIGFFIILWRGLAAVLCGPGQLRAVSRAWRDRVGGRAGALQYQCRAGCRPNKRHSAADDLVRRQFPSKHADLPRTPAERERTRWMKFVMAGGGTGGHIIPALAVAEELRSRGHEPIFVGTQRGMEARLVPNAGFPIEWIEIGGFNQVGLLRRLRTLWQLPLSVFKVFRFLGRIRPGAVFSMGGYVAGPVVLAAILRGVPIAVMEPNAIPGLTNRKLARFTARALVNFAETVALLPCGPRRSDRRARTPRVLRHCRQVRRGEIHSTRDRRESGLANIEQRCGERHGSCLRMRAFPSGSFTRRAAGMPSRSGISSRGAAFQAKLSSSLPTCRPPLRKPTSSSAGPAHPQFQNLRRRAVPSILVPFPFAADNHQQRNAEAMEREGAALLVLDHEMTGQRLFDEVTRLMMDRQRLEMMAAAAKSMANRLQRKKRLM